MNVRLALSIVLCLGFLGSGCNSIRAYPKRIVDEKAELKYLIPYFTNDVVKIYNEKTSTSDKREYRDEVVNGRLRAIDLQFEIFQKAINEEHNLSQIGADWAVLGLSGAGAVAGGASTKAILAAISGGLTGAKLSFDKTLYYEKTMPALLAQMEASRAKQLLNLRIGLQQGTTQYPLTQALVDVDNYYKVGTLPGAIIAIGNSAGAKTEEAQNKMGELLLEGSFVRDDAGDKLRKFWKPDGIKINADNQNKLKEWMQKPENNFDPDAITLFLTDKSEKMVEGRKKAAKDLGVE